MRRMGSVAKFTSQPGGRGESRAAPIEAIFETRCEVKGPPSVRPGALLDGAISRSAHERPNRAGALQPVVKKLRRSKPSHRRELFECHRSCVSTHCTCGAGRAEKWRAANCFAVRMGWRSAPDLRALARRRHRARRIAPDHRLAQSDGSSSSSTGESVHVHVGDLRNQVIGCLSH
jgi:hypothetical protein